MAELSWSSKMKILPRYDNVKKLFLLHSLMAVSEREASLLRQPDCCLSLEFWEEDESCFHGFPESPTQGSLQADGPKSDERRLDRFFYVDFRWFIHQSAFVIWSLWKSTVKKEKGKYFSPIVRSTWDDVQNTESWTFEFPDLCKTSQYSATPTRQITMHITTDSY